MPDDKSEKGEPDRSRVNIHEPYEVEYWKQKFGVSKQQLKDAVQKVGPSVESVRKELGR
jgi:hypothetical protein